MEAFLEFMHQHTGTYPYLFAFVAGVGFALPFGAMTIIALKQRNHHGFWAGFSVALACMLGDIILGITVFESYDFILKEFNNYRVTISFVVGAFLLLLGFTMIKTHHQTPPKASYRLYTFALIMTLSNPGNIIGFLTYNYLASADHNKIETWPNLAIILLGTLLTWLIVIIFAPKRKYAKGEEMSHGFPIGGCIVILLSFVLICNGLLQIA